MLVQSRKRAGSRRINEKDNEFDLFIIHFYLEGCQDVLFTLNQKIHVKRHKQSKKFVEVLVDQMSVYRTR